MKNLADQNSDNALIKLGKDILSLLMLNYLSVEGAVRLARTCRYLWHKSQGTLLTKLFNEEKGERQVQGLSYLIDAVELSPIFQEQPLNYGHLANVLSRAESVLQSTFKSDPYSAWKIAAICGLEEIVAKLLGDKIYTTYDEYGRGVREYYALGGQLDCLKRALTAFNPAYDDPDAKIARFAAIGGHIHILCYLRDEFDYDLKQVFPASANLSEETLLTYAVKGGDTATIDFLLAQGVDPNVGRGLAYYAAGSGHWSLYERFKSQPNPITNQQDALQIARFACRTNNFTYALALINEHRLSVQSLCADVIMGGDSKLFWHFVDQQWLSLQDKFANGATVEHLLALHGHFDLLKKVLQRKKLKKEELPLDNYQRNLLHYAAIGGHWNIYGYLLECYYQGDFSAQDSKGNSIAHTAARNGSAWFLKRLHQSNPMLVKSRNNKFSNVLHKAAQSAAPFLLKMIIDEFNFRLLDANSKGNTIAHQLAKHAAQNKTHLWNTLRFVMDNYGYELLDIEDYYGQTVREIIEENHAENYFPQVGFK